MRRERGCQHHRVLGMAAPTLCKILCPLQSHFIEVTGELTQRPTPFDTDIDDHTCVSHKSMCIARSVYTFCVFNNTIVSGKQVILKYPLIQHPM